MSIAMLSVLSIALLANLFVNNYRTENSELLKLLRRFIENPQAIYTPLTAALMEDIPQIRKSIDTIPDLAAKAELNDALGQAALASNLKDLSIELTSNARRQHIPSGVSDVGFLIDNQIQLADSYCAAEYCTHALELATEAAIQARAEFGENHTKHLNALAIVATAQRKLQDHTESRATAEKMLNLNPEGETQQEIRCRNAILAATLDRYRRPPGYLARRELETMLDKIDELSNSLHPPDKWVHTTVRWNRAIYLQKTGKFEQAAEQFREVLYRRLDIVGPSHIGSFTATYDLIMCIQLLSKRPDFDSVSAIEQLIDEFQDWGPKVHAYYLMKEELARALFNRSEIQAAIDVMDQTIIECNENGFGPLHDVTAHLISFRYMLEWNLPDRRASPEVIHQLIAVDALFEKIRLSRSQQLYSGYHIFHLKWMADRFSQAGLDQQAEPYQHKFEAAMDHRKQSPPTKD